MQPQEREKDVLIVDQQMYMCVVIKLVRFGWRMSEVMVRWKFEEPLIPLEKASSPFQVVDNVREGERRSCPFKGE